MARFQVHPVTDDNRLAERQSRLRAVPVHEFINGMAIAALSVRARETVENRGSGDLEIWQSQDRFGDTTLIFAGWLCLHHLWPPAPQVHIADVGCRPGFEWCVIQEQRGNSM